MLRLLVVASVLSLVTAGFGKWKAPCNPSTVVTDCDPNFQQCGPWAGEDDSWTDNRCYCIPYQNNNCCHGFNACSSQNLTCSTTPRIAQCDKDAHQCRSTCATLGQAAGLTGAAGTVIGTNSNGDFININNLIVQLTALEKLLLKAILALITRQSTRGDPKWTATDGTPGAGKKVSPDIQGAEVINGDGSSTTMLPISSSVALIFLAFFVGIILAYVIYKINKRKSQTKQDGLDSPRQALGDRVLRSSTSV